MPQFTPPTHEEPIRTDVRPLCYYRLTWAASVVRVDGVFRSVRTPSQALIDASGGVEGRDFFRGGRSYYVDENLAAKLETDGFAVNRADPGYGEGPYGTGPYGE